MSAAGLLDQGHNRAGPIKPANDDHDDHDDRRVRTPPRWDTSTTHSPARNAKPPPARSPPPPTAGSSLMKQAEIADRHARRGTDLKPASKTELARRVGAQIGVSGRTVERYLDKKIKTRPASTAGD
ncbi:hypothetical protein [Streptomyces flavidovirens]|uniref:hypothetical protein n=1 Tax=Streptomyces flavidovirens TaxID=67298 RepID=UPI0036A215E3